MRVGQKNSRTLYECFKLRRVKSLSTVRGLCTVSLDTLTKPE